VANYDLSEKARQDLIAIFEFGIDRFGADQAERYIERLLEVFEEIAENPDRFTRIPGLHPECRRAVVGSSSVYFLDQSSGVLIVRVIGRQDVSPDSLT